MNDLMSLIQNENLLQKLLFLILFDFSKHRCFIQHTYEGMHLGI